MSRWGLSGTPPCETLAQIRKASPSPSLCGRSVQAAGFLGVQLPQGGRAEERKVAQEWIDAFVRRNTAELPAIEEEEQIVAVRQTPKAGGGRCGWRGLGAGALWRPYPAGGGGGGDQGLEGWPEGPWRMAGCWGLGGRPHDHGAAEALLALLHRGGRAECGGAWHRAREGGVGGRRSVIDRWSCGATS